MPIDAKEQQQRQKRIAARPRPAVRQPVRSEVRGGGGTGLKWALIRAVDPESGEITVQQVRYADDPPTENALETVGEEMIAYPPPGHSAEMFNVERAVQPYLAGESLARIMPVLWNRDDNTIFFPLKLPANVGTVNAAAEVSEGGGAIVELATALASTFASKTHQHAGSEITSGVLPNARINANLRTFAHLFYLEDPGADDDDYPQWLLPAGANIQTIRVRAITDTGTVTFNIEYRTFAGFASSGTDILASDLTASTTEAETTVFANSGIIPAGCFCWPAVTSVTGTPGLLLIGMEARED